MALLKNDQPADAEPVLRECLSIWGKDKTGWWPTKARRVLAECLAVQGADPSLTAGARTEKFTEAETILVDLANSVLEDDTASTDDKSEAIQRVVDLYEAWHAAEPGQGYDAKANEWRAKLPEEESADERDK